MFRNMKLATKIYSGFGVILLMAAALGAVAVWNMNDVSEETVVLDKEFGPQVETIVPLAESVRDMMYHLRGYGYTEDIQFLELGKKSIEEIKKELAAAKDLAAQSSQLVKLKGEIGPMDAKLTEYFSLIDATREKIDGLGKNRKAMDQAANNLLQEAEGYRDDMKKKMVQEIQAGADPGKLIERFDKTTLINDIIDLGNGIRIANFKSQTLRDNKIVQEALGHFPKIDEKIAAALAVTTQDGNKKQLEGIRQAAQAYKAALIDPSGSWQALFDINNKRRDAGNAILAMTKELTRAGLERIDKSSMKTVEELTSASRITTAGLGLTVVLGILLAFFITRSITKPINRVVDGLKEGAEQVSSAAAQVSSSSQSLAEGSSEQAASIEETTSSLEEISSMTKQNADHAQQANHLMDETKQVVAAANESMKQLTVSMGEISAASEETSKIVKTIDEIAFQTNLLALNAAVEAARAGEAGAGFAVVADEVRNLAMRAAEAAKNTANLIEGTVKRVKDGSDVVARTNDAFHQVAGSSAKAADLVAEIAAASKEQAQGIVQINTAVAEMDKLTQQNAANAEESASASEELSAQAEQMQGMVSELVAVVGDSSKAQDLDSRSGHQAPTGVRKTHKVLSAAISRLKKDPPVKKAKDPVAESVIPLNDNEFAEF